MGRITSFSKQVIKFLICFSLIYTPTLLFAGAAESWTIEEVVYNDIGKNLTYTASKTGAAANDYIYKAKVPVTAAATGSTVASMIRMGLAGAAIYGIVEGVGWVIDNGVVKKKIVNNEDDSDTSHQYLWYSDSFSSVSNINQICQNDVGFSDINAAISRFKTCVELLSDQRFEFDYCKFYSVRQYNCMAHDRSNPDSKLDILYIGTGPNPNYDPNSTPFEPELVPVPDSELGDAINNSDVAPQVLPDIYNPNNPAGGAAPQKTADALDSAPPQPRTSPKTDIKKKPNSDTDGDGEPDVYDPSKPDLGSEFELPEFCSWAVTVCEWYKKYKDDSDLAKEHRLKQTEVWSKEELARQEEKQHRQDEKTFWQKVEDWFDWTKDDLPEYPDSQLDLPDQSDPNINTDLSFGGSCPASRSVPVSFAGISTEIEFSFQWFCEVASIAKPVVISISAFAAALIVAGVRTEDD